MTPKRKNPQVALAEAAMDALCASAVDDLRARVCKAIGYRLTKRTTDEQIVEAVERFAMRSRAKGSR